jgi:outer membrane receptor protein involved in Fe transport
VFSIGTRQVISFGGNARYNSFDLSLAPRGDSRSEGGAYVQDEIFINDYVRWVVGARLDRFSVLDKPNFSPRTALILKPAADHALRLSFNRAFRAPSLINNFLEVGIINQLDLRAINPLFALAPGGPVYNFPVQANGNEDLVEQQVDAFEAAYTGVIAKRATVTAAFYYNKSKDDIFFTQVGRYRATNPPAGWLNKVGPLVGTAQALGILEVLRRRASARPPAPAAASRRSSATATSAPSSTRASKWAWTRRSTARSTSLRTTPTSSPDPDFDISEVNLPPTNRFNAGFSFSEGMFLGNMNVSYQDSAFWQDVLDSRFHGTTEAYTQVNGALGVRWAGDKITTTVKFNNLFDREIQSHIFGDILRRQVIGELRVQF